MKWKDWPALSKGKIRSVNITVHQYDGEPDCRVYTTGGYWNAYFTARSRDEAKRLGLELVAAELDATAREIGLILNPGLAKG